MRHRRGGTHRHARTSQTPGTLPAAAPPVGAPVEIGTGPCGQDVDASLVYFRTVPTFETPAPNLQWLTRAIFIGTGERHPNDVIVRVWKVE